MLLATLGENADAVRAGFVAMELVCGCFLPLILLAVALVAGTLMEQSHVRALTAKEAELAGMIVTDTQAIPVQMLPPGGGEPAIEGELVLSSVVLSIDHFRNFVTALRKIIGGELGLYRRLAERARREALVRLLDEARQRGAVAVVNVRFETSNIRGVVNLKQNKGAMVEVLAYGTLLRQRATGTAPVRQSA